MILINRKSRLLKFQTIKKYGKFVVEPLERGYGTTLAIPREELCFLLFRELLSAR